MFLEGFLHVLIWKMAAVEVFYVELQYCGHESNGTYFCRGRKCLQDLRGNPHRDYIERISRSFLKKGVDEK